METGQMEQVAQQFFAFFIPLFFILFASVFVWFGMVSRLYKTLESEHPDIYEDMGKPTLFWNNSPRSAVVLVKFIMRKKYIHLGNMNLTRLGNFMYWFFIAYLLLFSVLFISVFLMTLFVGSNINS